jgi:PAS domain S-box-containing protein
MASSAPFRSSIVVLVALASLVGCLGFVTFRLLQADRTFRISDEGTLWMVTQAQYEAALFGRALALVAAGQEPATSEDDLVHRYTVLMSRVDVFIDGPLARAVSIDGNLAEIRKTHEALLTAEPAIEAGLDHATAARLERQVVELGRKLRSLGNSYLHTYREQGAADRDRYLRAILEGIAAVFGITISAIVLGWRLLEGTRQTRRAEKLLRQEQAFSDLVVNLSDQGILILDKNRTCLLWNPGMKSLFGLEPRGVIGQAIENCVPLFNSSALNTVLEAAGRGTSGTIEDESVEQDGQARCLEISCHPLSMADSHLVVVFVRDATERWLVRKRAEQHNVQLESEVKQRTEALHEAKDRLVAAINTASEGFAAFDQNGTLLIANERIRKMEPVAGCYRDGMALGEFLGCFATCEGADARLLRSGHAFISTINLDLQLGGDAWAHLAVTKAEGGTIFVRLSDVTPYKKAALALQSALDREREITSAYRSFVSMVSHQFRTPLAIVDSTAQRILRRGAEASPDELAMRAKKIRNATVRLTRLVESVLNAARIDSGQIEINHAPCDLVQLVADVCEHQRDISPGFDIRFVASAHPVELTCDAMLIEQVLINLLSNAVKYSGAASRIEVRLWTDGTTAKCSVRDWGIGIPAEELPKVFDRFYRASTAAGIAGTGIGLNVAREIVRIHGGEIEVESCEGQGSVFTLSMPTTGVLAAPQAA